MTRSQHILLCGHRSFAANGLIEILEQAGHTVVTFSRGPVKREGRHATGPVDQLHENPELGDNFDTVLNYILLKDDTIEQNDRYLDSLLKFCAVRNVRHLVHISSMSVYKGEVRVVREDAEVESVPSRKGSYGSLKVAQDLFLSKNAPAELRLSMVRPGFILAPGLLDPMIGMGLRMFRNKVLLLGAQRNHLPVVTRELVHQTILRVVNLESTGKREAFLAADPDSPTRRAWLEACCTVLGCGTGVVSFPPLLWRLAGWMGEPVARLARLKISPSKIMSNVCRAQRFDTSHTQTRLGLPMQIDWRAALKASFAGQHRNFSLPYQSIDLSPVSASRISMIGYGQVVKQKHLPALKGLNFTGEIDAFDITARRDPTDGREIRSIDSAVLSRCDLVVLASPGPSHTSALPLLRTTESPVLVEKPLCYTQEELDQWLVFAKARNAPVRVCQNYRFKSHVAAMMTHLARFEPGKLLRVDLTFQSPAVGKDWRTWARDERGARTLLMDYAIHYLDIACMFNTESWNLDSCRYELDHLGHTAAIEGRMSSPAYPVNFILRQGLMPRRARLLFTFQNYLVSLGFYPDTFVPHMADDSAALYEMEKRSASKAMTRKILDKLSNRDSDASHAAAYKAALSPSDGLGRSLTVEALSAYYRVVFEIGQRVYTGNHAGA